MADDFTRKRLQWLDQVASDPAISGSTCKLAIYIACRFLNRKTNTAWPSQPVLAELLGLRTRGSVRYCVDQLVTGGHLAVAVSHGRGTSNRYRIILKDVAAADDGPDESELFPNDDPEASSDAESLQRGASSTPETLFPDLLPAKAKAAIDESFDLWWQQFPKKAGKAAALKAYTRIINKGEASPEELLTGVMRYAAAQTGKDPKYIKHPQGWLNDARWTDEVAPVRMSSDQDGFRENHSARARSSGGAAQSWMEIGLGRLKDGE